MLLATPMCSSTSSRRQSRQRSCSTSHRHGQSSQHTMARGLSLPRIVPPRSVPPCTMARGWNSPHGAASPWLWGRGRPALGAGGRLTLCHPTPWLRLAPRVPPHAMPGCLKSCRSDMPGRQSSPAPAMEKPPSSPCARARQQRSQRHPSGSR